MATPLRRSLSHLVGWLADRRIPTPLRAPLYRLYARATGADLSEAVPPLEAYASLSAFFVRRLRGGARPFPPDTELLPSPVDGRVQSIDRVRSGTLLQAKGREYAVRELLAGVGADVDLEGASAWTLYLSPRDYHRIHAPDDLELHEARWIGGARRPVAPSTAARVPRLFATNERCVLSCRTGGRPFFLVLVGAINVGRIRVVGVRAQHGGRLDPPRLFARGDELARFELGSTVILIHPAGGPEPVGTVRSGDSVRMGEVIGELRGTGVAAPPR